jgi:predicted Zn-dependent peptidase
LAYDLPGQSLAAAALAVDLPLSAEPPDLEGVATIMARCLDEGTEARDGGEFARLVERAGAAYRVDTDLGGIRVAISVPGSRLSDGLRLLAEAVTRPVFPTAEVDRHVRLRLAGLAQIRATPQPRAAQEILAACFRAESRESRPAGGTAATVRAITREATAACYRKHVGPRRATLVIAGDLGDADLPELVHDALGEWDRAVPAAPVPTAPLAAEPSVVIVDRPGSVQTHVVLGTPVPGRHHGTWADLTVASCALGGGISSRLMRVLREEKGYTYGVKADLAPLPSGGLFTVVTAVHAEHTAASVATALDVLGEVAANGLTRAERDTAAEFRTGADPLGFQTAEQVTDFVGSCVVSGLTDDYPAVLRAAIAETTAASVSAAFREHVSPGRLSVVAIGDASVILRPLRDCLRRDIEVRPA